MYLSHEDKNYKYVDGKLFLVESTLVSKIGIFIFSIAMLVVIYDIVKDFMRTTSVYGDIFRGRQVDVAKAFGFTKGNMTRNIIKYSLLVISIVMMSNTENTQVNPIPKWVVEST